MSLRQRWPSLNGNGHIPHAIVREDAYHSIEWESDQGLDGIAIYVSYFAFRDLKYWRESRIGERILKELYDSKYDNHIKCIYFDPIMRREIGEEEEGDVLQWTCMSIDVAFAAYDKEDILLLIFCTECCNLCTIQKRVDNLPMFDPGTSECQECYQQSRSYFT